MSPRAEKFCLEYAKTGNATESYKAVGYKYKNDHSARSAASQLLTNLDVQKKLKEIAAEIKTAKIADTVECQELLTEIARDKRQKGAVRVQALTTLLKAQGAFSTQINLNAVAPIVLVDDVNE